MIVLRSKFESNHHALDVWMRLNRRVRIPTRDEILKVLNHQLVMESAMGDHHYSPADLARLRLLYKL
jgi:hypothetical protein